MYFILNLFKQHPVTPIIILRNFDFTSSETIYSYLSTADLVKNQNAKCSRNFVQLTIPSQVQGFISDALC